VSLEEAGSLRLLITVGACGPFVAVLRNHAEIVLAHANRESAKSAVRLQEPKKRMRDQAGAVLTPCA
jgi:hypothetical protein